MLSWKKAYTSCYLSLSLLYLSLAALNTTGSKKHNTQLPCLKVEWMTPCESTNDFVHTPAGHLEKCLYPNKPGDIFLQLIFQ